VPRVITAVATGLVTTLLTVAPAFANDPLGPQEGADPGKGLSPLQTILLYVVVPLAIFGVIALLVLLPGAVRSYRYRPAEGWAADPVWFAGPVDPDAAVAGADRTDVVRGGASGSW
jgi:hypothetical protein